jgi:hypothetical protein
VPRDCLKDRKDRKNRKKKHCRHLLLAVLIHHLQHDLRELSCLAFSFITFAACHPSTADPPRTIANLLVTPDLVTDRNHPQPELQEGDLEMGPTTLAVKSSAPNSPSHNNNNNGLPRPPDAPAPPPSAPPPVCPQQLPVSRSQPYGRANQA